jgi:hypothetical protein
MGEFEKGIIKQANQQRKALPDKIANAPVLGLGLDFYWEAFLLLSSERSGESAIPWTAMQAYAFEIGITDVDDRQDFYFILREIDLKFIDLTVKKRSKMKELNKVKGRSGVRKRG